MYRHVSILVADDNPHDAFFLKRAFDKAGINAPMHFVEDGEQTVNYLQGLEPFTDRSSFPLPNLLLLDLKMPRLDGFGVLRWVRGQDGLRRLPVLILSSSGERRDVDLAHELGANAYTVKPATADELFDLVLALERFWLRRSLFPSLDSDPFQVTPL